MNIISKMNSRVSFLVIMNFIQSASSYGWVVIIHVQSVESQFEKERERALKTDTDIWDLSLDLYVV